MILQEQLQKTKLVAGTYTASQANDIVNALIDAQINLYKLLKLSAWVGDHSENNSAYSEKIEELKNQKYELKNLVHQARMEGAMLQLDGSLELQFVR